MPSLSSFVTKLYAHNISINPRRYPSSDGCVRERHLQKARQGLLRGLESPPNPGASPAKSRIDFPLWSLERGDLCKTVTGDRPRLGQGGLAAGAVGRGAARHAAAHCEPCCAALRRRYRRCVTSPIYSHKLRYWLCWTLWGQMML